MQDRERANDSISVRRSRPHNTNPEKGRREIEKQWKTKRERTAVANDKNIVPAIYLNPLVQLYRIQSQQDRSKGMLIGE